MTNTEHEAMQEAIEEAVLRVQGAIELANKRNERGLAATLAISLDTLGDAQDELDHTMTVEEAAA